MNFFTGSHRRGPPVSRTLDGLSTGDADLDDADEYALDRDEREMSDDRLAYTLKEAAAKLGGISVRSVQRIVARGLLPTVRVMRRVLIPAEALQRLVAAEAAVLDNVPGAEPVAWKGVEPCYSNARGRHTGMSVTGTRAATELGALLARLTEKKRQSEKRNGGSRSGSNGSGVRNLSSRMTK